MMFHMIYIQQTGIIQTNTATIGSLAPNTRYMMYVIALSGHGSSLPSYTVSAFTSQGGPIIPGSNETLLGIPLVKSQIFWNIINLLNVSEVARLVDYFYEIEVDGCYELHFINV